MLTLQQRTVNLNQNLVLSNNDGNLSNDAGLILVAEIIHQIHLKRLLKETLHLSIDMLTQLITEYFNDTAASKLATDLSFKLTLDNLVASQPTLSHFINQIFAENLAGITKLIAKLAQLVITPKRQHQLIIDLDSTHSDTLGHQRF